MQYFSARFGFHFLHTLLVLLLEPVNENLHNSSHYDNENEELLVLGDVQNTNDTEEEKEEGGTKGEDWDEVRI